MAATTRAPHRGRCGGFEREVDLGPPVRAWLEHLGAEVAEEVEVGVGVADLVGAIGDPDDPGSASAIMPVVDSLQLSVLHRCADGASEQELRDWAPWGWRGLRDRALGPLLHVGLMTEDEGVFHAVDLPRNPFAELVAVELKLRAWNRGVAQAGAYRTFAARSWIALPSERITSALLDHASHNAVGVLGVDRDQTVMEIAAAAHRQPLRPKTVALVAQRVLAARTAGVHRRAGSTIC